MVFTKLEQSLEDVTVAPPDVISDHSLISWRLSFLQQPPVLLDRETRCWSKLDKDRFRSALLNSALCKTDVCLDAAEEYFDIHEYVAVSGKPVRFSQKDKDPSPTASTLD